MKRHVAFGGAVAAAAVIAGGAAGPVAAGARVAPRTLNCTEGEGWTASTPRQAWLPAGSVLQNGTLYSPGQGFTLTKGTERSETNEYTVATQLGADSGIDLEVIKIGDSVNVSKSTSWSTLTSSTVSVSQQFTNPLNEPAKPYMFLEGYRIKATLYQQSCTPPNYPRTRIRSRYIYLYKKNPQAIAGWVGANVTPYAVVQPWSAAHSISNT